jgi:ABC-type ATPase with predicted acetyltransferase domain
MGGHAEKIAEMFGAEAARQRRPRIRRHVPVVIGRVTLIVGDSGSGKSTLLAATARRLRREGWAVFDVAEVALDPRAAVVETFGALPLACIVETLSRAGFAEAGAMLRPATALSEGQKFRYRLARVLASAGACAGNAAIVADEFAANLDATSARVAAFGLRKMIAGKTIAALIVTPREDVEADLRPAAVVRLGG